MIVMSMFFGETYKGQADIRNFTWDFFDSFKKGNLPYGRFP